MPDPNYKELENEDELTDGYTAQDTIEGKFYYILNYNARNIMIMQSGNYLSEKERLSMGMKPATYTENTKQFDKSTARSEFQVNMEQRMEQTHYFTIQNEFFSKDGKKKNVTLDGCRRFFESRGSLEVKPCLEIGKRYDEVNLMIPDSPYSKEEMDFKTKFLMRYGLPKESALAESADMLMQSVDNAITANQIFTSVDTKKSRSMCIKPLNAIKDELKKHYDKSLGEIMDIMNVRDKEERDHILEATGCNEQSTLSDAFKASQKTIQGAFESEFAGRIAKAWKNQGLKKALGALSEKELLAYKRGKETLELNSSKDKKYKEWIKDEGIEMAAELQHREFKAAFKDCNKIIHTKKSLGVPTPSGNKTVNFSDLEKIQTFSTVDRARNKAEVDKQAKKDHLARYEASVRYKAYVESNTGKPSESKEKNVEKLSKAMAAAILSDSKHIKTFSTKIINNTAEKLTKTLDLGKLDNEEMKTALQSPAKVNDLLKKQVTELFTPSNVHNLLVSMEYLSNDMMAKRDRSPEYQNLVNAVTKMAKLNSDKAGTPEVKNASIQVGFEVMLAAENYMKGKKSVRSTDDGKERFDNALDALGVLYKNVPGLRSHIDELVDKTNRVRGAKDPNHKDHVDIEKYGNERAREAKMNRGLKAQGIKPQKNNIIK